MDFINGVIVCGLLTFVAGFVVIHVARSLIMTACVRVRGPGAVRAYRPKMHVKRYILYVCLIASSHS